MTTSKEGARRVRAYAAWLVEQGFTVDYSNGHYRISDPAGVYRSSMPSSPSDQRSYLNTLSSARRAGLPTPPKTRQTKKKADR